MTRTYLVLKCYDNDYGIISILNKRSPAYARRMHIRGKLTRPVPTPRETGGTRHALCVLNGRDIKIPWRHTAAQFALVPLRPPLYARGTLDKMLFVRREQK